MAEGGDVTRLDRHDDPCAQPDASCLLFTEVRQAGCVSVGHQTVDIRTKVDPSMDLRFNLIKSGTITLSHGRTRARRNDAFTGICYSERPIKPNEKVYVRILDTEQVYHGALVYGFSTWSPELLSDTEYPRAVGGALSNMPGTLYFQVRESLNEANNVLCFWYTESGIIYGDVNGQYTQILSTKTLDMDSAPVWAVFDVFGATSAIQLTKGIAGNECQSSEEVVSLVWPGFLDRRSSFSTCCVQEPETNVDLVLLDTMCAHNFRALLQVAVMLFRDYRTRLMAVRRNPLSFDLVHNTFSDFEYLQENTMVLTMNLRNLCEETRKLSLDLRIHVAGAPDNNRNEVMLTSPDAATVPGLHAFRKLQRDSGTMQDELNERTCTEINDLTPLLELERLERVLLEQSDRIQAKFKRRLEENAEMLASVGRLLNRSRHSDLSVDQHNETTESVLEQSLRDMGDGAEFPTAPVETTVTLQQETVTIEPVDTTVTLQQETVTIEPVETTVTLQQETVTIAPVETTVTLHQETVTIAPLSETIQEPQEVPKQSRDVQSDVTLEAGETEKNDKNNARSNKSQHVAHTDGSYNVAQNINRSNRVNELAIRASSRDSEPHNVGTGPRANALDTFICFNTSGTELFANKEFEDIRHLALEIIDGIQKISTTCGIEENIGIVALGTAGNWIKTRPTNDYDRVRQTLLKIQLKSVLLADVLQQAIDFRNEAGKCYTHDDDLLPIGPRLLVLTSGMSQPTPEENDRVFSVIGREPKQSERSGHHIAWIVADHRHGGYVRTLAEVFGGEYILPSSLQHVYKFQLLRVTVYNIMTFIRDEWRRQAGFKPVDVDYLLDMFASHLDKRDQAMVGRIVCHHLARLQQAPEFVYSGRRDFPPVGSRVVRGEDWIWDKQDGGGPGTVVDQDEDNERVSVEWDYAGTGWYRYGDDGAYDVMVVTDRPRVDVSDYLIDVGREVKRGPDWGMKDEDGGVGGVGVVVRSLEDGTVQIRWRRTGNLTTHQCGLDKAELTFRDPKEILEEVRGQTTSKTQTQQSISPSKPTTDDELSPLDFICKHANERDNVTASQKFQPKTRQESLNVWNRHPVNQQSINDKEYVKSQPNQKQATKDLSCTLALGSSRADAYVIDGPASDQNVWQRQDQDGQWQNYSREDTLKLEQSFTRRSTGTCLLTRNGESYRVLFRTMEEKCITSNNRRTVRRISSNKQGRS